MPNLHEIEGRLNKATQGRWEAIGSAHDDDGLTTIFGTDEDGDIDEPVAMAAEDAAEFIVHAPEDIRELLYLARQQQRRIDGYENTKTANALGDAQAEQRRLQTQNDVLRKGIEKALAVAGHPNAIHASQQAHAILTQILLAAS